MSAFQDTFDNILADDDRQQQAPGGSLVSLAEEFGWDRDEDTGVTAQRNVENRSNFTRGLLSGIDQTQAMLGGAVGLAGDAVGADAIRDFGFNTYQDNLKEAEQNPVDVQNFTDIESASDAGKWFLGTLGNLVPSMAEGAVSAIAGGGIFGLAGRKMAVNAIDRAVAALIKRGVSKEVAEKAVQREIIEKVFIQKAKDTGADVGLTLGVGALEGGGMWGEDAAEHGVENANAGSAAALGLVSGASEVVSPGGLLLKRLTGMKGISPVSDKVVDAFHKRITPEIAKGMSGEAAQEVFQTFLGTLNKKIQDPTVSLTDREAILEYINSGAAGAAGGLVFGGVNAVFPESRAELPDLSKYYTVDDVLNDHRARLSVESAAVKDGLGRMQGQTVDDVLLSAEQAGQFVADTSQIIPAVREMAGELFRQPGEDGNAELPSWVKLRALKDWEKQTGEEAKKYVNSKTAKDTLKAVIDGRPLSQKQQKVWGYLKAVAENRTSLQYNLTGQPSTAEQSANVFGGGAMTDAMKQAERQYDARTAFENELAPVETLQPQFEAPAQSEPEPWDAGNGRNGINVDEVVNKETGEIRPAVNQQGADEERIADMISVLRGKKSREELDLAYEQMVPIFYSRPELSQYRDRFDDAYNDNYTKFGLPEDSVISEKSVKDDRIADEPLPEPINEKHEVIDNHDSAAHGQEVNTNPSEAQKGAENYKMAHVSLDGMDISIENPAGSTRSGKDDKGREWSTTMQHDYGRIKGTVGYDKDHVDVFIAKGYQGGADNVYVVNQHKANGRFDEHKVVLGAKSVEEAKDTYLANYENGWTGGKTIVEMPVSMFKEWVKLGGPQKDGALQGGVSFSKVDTPELPQAEQPTIADTKLVSHTVKGGKNKGSIIKGVVRTDLTKEQAKAIDRFTFPKDGGFFIREKYLGQLPAEKKGYLGENTSSPELKNQDETTPPVQGIDSQSNVLESGLGENFPLLNEDGRRVDGKPILPGDIFTTSSGRKTTPYPRYSTKRDNKTQKSLLNKWLIDNYRQEAIAKGDDFNQTLAEALDADNFSQADGDSANMYLFGKQPNIIKPFLKELVSKNTEDEINANTKPVQQDNTPVQPDRDTAVDQGVQPTQETPEAELQGVAKEPAVAEKPTEKIADKPSGEFSGNKIFTADAVAAARERLKAKRGTLSSGFDPTLVHDVLIIGGAYFESGIRKFADWSKAVLDDIGQEFMPFLPGAYENLRRYPGLDIEGMNSTEFVDEYIKGLDTKAETPKPVKAEDVKVEPDKQEQAETETTQQASKSPEQRIADQVKKYLSAGESFNSSQLFTLAANAYGGTMANNMFTPKDAYDSLELGINQFLADGFAFKSEDPAERVAELENLLSLVPTQTKRTAEQDNFQQYSTPPTFSYVANWVANLRKDDTYLEPSAGIGGLAVFGKISGVNDIIVNELSARRRKILENMGFDTVYGENAEQLNNVLPAEVKPTVIVMNPPFSATGGRVSKNKTKYGAQHIEQALKRLAPGGRLVAIVGEGMAHGKPTFAKWWKDIEEEYNVRANVGANGEGYRKYGTTFDNQLLVIDKTGPTTDNIVTGKVDSYADLIPLLSRVRDERAAIDQQPANQPTGQAEIGTAGPVSGSEQTVPPATSDVEPGQRGTADEPGGGGNNRVDAAASADGMVQSGNKQRSRRGGSGKPGRQEDVTGEPGVEGVGLDREPAPDADLLDVSRRDSQQSADSTVEGYQPTVIISGAKQHPADLVESAAMSAVKLPNITYQPKLPKSTITKGLLSDVQLEAISAAGHAHQDILPNGERRGFFIGDGTGVGKGREIAGIMFDNWNNGRRRAIWVSKDRTLAKDAKRDMNGIGWSGDHIIEQGKVKAGEDLPNRDGVVFTAYSTVSSKPNAKQKSRLDSLIEWAGPDFDGVIAFDESHKMGNAIEIKDGRYSKKPSEMALAALDLQAMLPKARVVYVSATGATEVSNLAYANRLGLWGEGTAFQNVQAFVGQVSLGGIAAMEVVARDMKATGSYLARKLAYNGQSEAYQVKYKRLEHDLSDDQREIYDELAAAWQIVLANIEDALGLTGADSRGRGQALSAFWGAHQRFFNQVLTAMQMPSVIKSIRQDIKEGKAVVLQITNTNEASTTRALAKAETIEDVDITPRDQLMQLIENSFPVQQYEDYEDENGNTRSRPVVDSEGKPVLNREAIDKREELLDKLGAIRVPDAPLEQIIDTFGVDNVAEVTGRSKRIVTIDDGTGPKKVRQGWSKTKGVADAALFMDDKKQILIFSEAGGTGASYHADNTAKNKRQRSHYILQAGWRADAAVQGLGRSHRSNQAVAPEYVLVTTDLKGHKRFISSIARRLSQLGALTEGERTASSQGLFSERDNLESAYATDAVYQLIYNVHRGQVPGIDFDTLVRELGEPKLADEHGQLNTTRIPNVTKFLNRILSMKIDMQNRVFDAFSAYLDANISAAEEAGTLDVGMETLKAEDIRVVDATPIFTEPKSGAVTEYVQLDVDYPTKKVGFDVRSRYVVNNQSGKTWRVGVKSSRTGEDGSISERVALVNARGTLRYVTEKELEENFSSIRGADAAREAWQKEMDAIPALTTQREHLITGALLPIWDKLKGTSAKVVRVVTKNDTMLGRMIPGDSIKDVMDRLGVDGKAVDMSPEQLMSAVLDNNQKITLDNEWTIRKRRVADESRIEIEGYGYHDYSLLQNMGAFSERIQYKTRLFVPTGESGVAVLKRILDSHKVMTVTGNGPKISDIITGEDGRAYILEDLAKTVYEKAVSLKEYLGKLKDILGKAFDAVAGKLREMYLAMNKHLDKVTSGAQAGSIRVSEETDPAEPGYVPPEDKMNPAEPKPSVSDADHPITTDALQEIAETIKEKQGKITFIKNKKVDSTFLDRVLSTPEYYFKKFGAAGRVLQAALLRRDVRYQKEQEVLEDFVTYIQDLRKKAKKAYDQANEYLVTTDQEADGFRIKSSKNDDRWEVHAPLWAVDGKPDNQLIGEFTEEQEAIRFMIMAEAGALRKEGYSQEAITAIVKARELTNRAFNIMAADMRAIIAEAKENGLPDPFIGDGQLDESGRYGVYEKGKKKPIATFASEKEAERMINAAAEIMSYIILDPKGKKKRKFRSRERALQWAAKRTGYTVSGQRKFGNLYVKRRQNSELRPLTVKEALAQMGDLRGIYFPRIRQSGEYVLIAKKDGANPIRKHFDIPSTGDNHKAIQRILEGISIGKLEIGIPIAREARKLRMRGYDVTIERDTSPAEDVFDSTKIMTSVDAIMQSSMDVVDLENPSEIKIAQHVNQLLTMQIADIFKSRGYLSSRIKRLEGDTVWEGYEEDMGKALTQYAKNIASGTAKRDTARAMVLAFSGRDYSWQQYKQEVDEPKWEEYQQIVADRRIDPGKQKNLFRDVRSFIVDVLRNDEQVDRIIGTMKGLAVLKYLGFRVSSAAVNVTNMVQGVPATISGHTGESLKDALVRVTAAATAYGKYRTGKGNLSQQDRDIFEYISAKGWDEAQFNHEAASELRSKLGDGWNKFMTASMFMFGATEKANRAMTLFAAYKAVKAKNQNMDEEVVWERAKEISDRAHGVYGKETLPAWARGKYNPLRLTYTFQKFSHNYMLNMYDLGFNRKEYQAAAYMLLSPALLAGTGASLASPLLMAAAGIFGIGGDDPEEAFYQWADDTFGGGDFVRHGIFSALNINIKGSLQINNPMPTSLEEFAGAPGGIIKDTYQGLSRLFKGEMSKGVELLLPTAFGSFWKSYREASEGITTSNYGTVFYGDEPLQADTSDAIVRFLSFNPSRISGIREKQWHEKSVKARYDDDKQEIYSEIKRLRLKGDGLTPEVLKEIYKYNERVRSAGRPDIKPITAESITLMLRRNAKASKLEKSRAV